MKTTYTGVGGRYREMTEDCATTAEPLPSLGLGRRGGRSYLHPKGESCVTAALRGPEQPGATPQEGNKGRTTLTSFSDVLLGFPLVEPTRKTERRTVLLGSTGQPPRTQGRADNGRNGLDGANGRFLTQDE